MDIGTELIKWYKLNKRDLPWRNTLDPYKIWISEVILQQTRVIQALGYYKSFITEFPDVNTLAGATEDKLLKLWQGLGYYSRARNLHHSAKFITNELRGKFPDNYKDLLQLKGVGKYTAAAIASFAYSEKIPVVDGNVYRVLSRLFAEKSPINSSPSEKIFHELAYLLIKPHKPDEFNQAIMEFGALQCVPGTPDCRYCPLQTICLAFAQKRVTDLPVKIKSNKTKIRYFNYFFINNDENTFIKKRNSKDIWQGLFEFPLLETKVGTNQFDFLLMPEIAGLLGTDNFEVQSYSENMKHQLTHQRLEAVFYEVKITRRSEKMLLDKGYIKITFSELKDFPVPKLIENYINKRLDNNR